jgi:hypothetical protein
MKHRTILLDPAAGETAGGGETQVTAPAPKQQIQAPRAPTPEELKVEFTADPDLDIPSTVATAADGKTVVPDKKVEAPAPKKEGEVKPIVPPAAEKKADTPEDKGVKPILPLSVEKKAQRDYTGFTAEEQAVFKQMSHEAFEYTAKVVREKKELEKLKGATFLQHPEGYTLDPAFKEIQIDAHFVNKEFKYWQSQLERITNGEQWQPILKWDAEGNPVLGPARTAGPMDAEQVRLNMNQCLQISQQKQQAMQQFVGSYQQRVQADNVAIQQERAKRFGWVADPKLMDEKVNVEGLGDLPIREVRTNFINMFPPYHHNSPAVEVAADLYVALQIYGAKLKEAEAGKQVAQIKTEEVLRAEPSGGGKPAAKGKTFGGVSTFSIEGLP